MRPKLRRIEDLLGDLGGFGPLDADALRRDTRTALAARLVPSAGMRNVLVHAYLDVDHDIVADAIPIARRDFGEYTREVAAWLRALPAS